MATHFWIATLGLRSTDLDHNLKWDINISKLAKSFPAIQVYFMGRVLFGAGLLRR